MSKDSSLITTTTSTLLDGGCGGMRTQLGEI